MRRFMGRTRGTVLERQSFAGGFPWARNSPEWSGSDHGFKTQNRLRPFARPKGRYHIYKLVGGGPRQEVQ
jgi:hypothetical protein